MLASALAILLAAATTSQAKLPLRACVVQGVSAKCGTLLVPENRDTGIGPRIGLRVVVVPARRKPSRPDAFAYLAGGPGGAATEQTAVVEFDLERGARAARHPARRPARHRRLAPARVPAAAGEPGRRRDDQGLPRVAERRLDTVRDGCRRRRPGGRPEPRSDTESLDLYGVSYGATLAQVYLARHPRSVRTVALDGATLLDVPFFGRFAVNGQRALDLTARRCAREPACARAFPSWPAQLRSVIEAWNAKSGPGRTRELTLSGDDLAGVIQYLTLNAASAASIPLVVSRAARGDYAPLVGQIPSSGGENPLMFWPIWCNERWVGLDATGPWGTYLDGYVASQLENYRNTCGYVPDHAEPASNLARVRSNVPLLAFVGGADPQDPGDQHCRARGGDAEGARRRPAGARTRRRSVRLPARASSRSSSTAAARRRWTRAACARPSRRLSRSAERGPERFSSGGE